MTSSFPEQDLECPDPARCSVGDSILGEMATAGSLVLTMISSARHWYRVYDAQDGHSQPNPGFGDTRFAPFDSHSTGERVPTIYLAESLAAALLETSLHDVHTATPRVVPELSLHGKLHARLAAPRDLTLIDLRDPQLERLGLDRTAVSSSAPEHYPCTRRLARSLHATLAGADGLIWHSRQAELTEQPAAEVAVVFCDRVSTSRGSWSLAEHRTAAGSLLEGAGRLMLEELADQLDVTIALDGLLDD